MRKIKNQRIAIWGATAALAWLLATAPATAAEPVNITAIDARTGIVAASGSPGTFTLQFKVKNPAQLRSLKIGQVVSADLGTQKVSINHAEPINDIVSVKYAASGSPTGVTGQASMNAPGDPFGGGGRKTKVTQSDFPGCTTCMGDCKVCTDSNMQCLCTQVASGSSPGPEDDVWSCACTGSEPKIPKGK